MRAKRHQSHTDAAASRKAKILQDDFDNPRQLSAGKIVIDMRTTLNAATHIPKDNGLGRSTDQQEKKRHSTTPIKSSAIEKHGRKVYSATNRVVQRPSIGVSCFHSVLFRSSWQPMTSCG